MSASRYGPKPDHTQVPKPAALRPLSCKSCRQRKVKCNKVTPCGPCQRSGVDCVFPSRVRKPRARSGALGRDEELLNRISRLENLVERFGGEVGLNKSVAATSPQDAGVPNKADVEPDTTGITAVETASVANRYMGGHFWGCLVEEVDGLKQLLEQSSDDDEQDMDASLSPSGSSEPSYLPPTTFVFGGPRVPLAHPPLEQAAIFFNAYFNNVDPICKILHKPTVMALLPKAGDFATSAPAGGALPALLFSMYFAAVTSMSSADCMELFYEERNVLLSRYKDCTETALANADFLNSTELMTLQAFTIYLLSLRNHSNTRSGWTLISLAVRIAHSLGLHRDGKGLAFSGFDAELRRRLWWSIVILDNRSAEDRGSDPLIVKNSFSTKMPLNVNDDDFGPLSELPLLERAEPTEMIFCRLVYNVSDVLRRLSYVPAAAVLDSPQSEDLQRVEDEIKGYSRKVELEYLANCDPTNPLHRFSSIIGQVLVAKLWLYFWYPLSQQTVRTRKIPREQSFKTAVSVLELAALVDNDPTLEPFHWFALTFVQWHPLAVVLADLCTRARGPLVDRAWAIIDNVYQKWAERVADTKQGGLWKPIRILYKKAQAVRQKDRVEVNVTTEPMFSLESIMVPALQSTNLEVGAQQQINIGSIDTNIPHDPPAPILPWVNPLDMGTFSIVDFYGDPMDWQIWNEFVSDAEQEGALVQSDVFTGWPSQG